MRIVNPTWEQRDYFEKEENCAITEMETFPQDRLDMGDVSVIGHGLGGATAIAACSFTLDFQV